MKYVRAISGVAGSRGTGRSSREEQENSIMLVRNTVSGIRILNSGGQEGIRFRDLSICFAMHTKMRGSSEAEI